MTESSAETPPRRLLRSRHDRMLGGVAGGIGAYFGIDAVLVRLVFVILAFAGGGGVLAYLVAWVIIPEEPSDSPAPTSTGGSPPASPALAGLLLVGLGGVLLIAQLIPGVSWRIVAPLILVAGGVLLLIRRPS